MASPSSAARPILVVDDDPDMRGLLRDVLALEGCAVLTAGSGIAAAHLPRAVPRALILLDLNLGDCRGETLAPLLRAWYADNVPIVALTGAPDARPRLATRREVAALLLKPFDLNDLLAVVRALAGAPARAASASRPSAPTSKPANTPAD